MRNFKRALSGALASVMVMGMMVTGASAAGYESFKDKADIEHKDAVSMVTELGVIAGLPGGVYGPEQNIDRASFARLVCVTLNGGKEPMLGNLKTSFSDTQGNWAEKYIAYCVDRGIIAGKGNNTFAPSANVTGSEAAKMLLVALGYNASYEGIGGATWQITTDVLANQAGLYNELDGMNTSDALTRDQAAQMIYNTMHAMQVTYKYMGGTAALREETGKTMIADKFNVVAMDDIVTLNKDNEAVIKVDKESVVVDLGLLGKNVTVYVRNGKVVGSPVVNDKNVIVTDATGEKLADLAKDNDLKLAGTKYFVNYEAVASEFAPIAGAETVLIDNNDDGKIDVATQVRDYFGEVTYYSTKVDGKITIKLADGTELKGDAEMANFDDVRKGDMVLVSFSAGEITALTEVETVTGTVNSIRGSKAVVDGTTYEASGLVALNLNKALSGKLGEDVVLYLDNAGYVLAVEDVEDAEKTDEYLVVTKIAKKANEDVWGEASSIVAKVVLADGSEKTVTVNLDKDGKDSVKTLTKGMYTYEVDADGNYNVKDAKAATETVTIAKNGITLAAGVRANNATVFVIGDKDGKNFKAYTGINNVPTLKNSVSALVVLDGTTAELVYVENAELKDAEKDPTKKIAYVYDELANVTKNEDDELVYSWNVVIDGEYTTVSAKTEIFTAAGLYNVKLDGTEVTSAKAATAASKVLTAENGVIDLKNGSSYVYTDATEFVVIDDTDTALVDAEYIVTTSQADKADQSDVIVIADEDDANLAAYVYIVE